MEINSQKGVLIMSKTAQKWGNSIGVRIPQVIAKQFNVEDGTQIEIRAGENEIILRPITNKPKLEDLLAQITKDNQHEEVDWDKPEGEEIW